ncbi:MAG: ribosome biogenesis GTPase Der [Arenicellales bacterium]
MIPVIALVGRPNVGKSTLFNRLTKSRDAIVDGQPGVTRDRLYGRGKMGDKPFLVVDTGGLESEQSHLGAMIRQQVEQVLEEAQGVVLLVDGKDGLVPQDREIGEQLRQGGRKVKVVVNKTEGEESELAVSEFQELGLGPPSAVSALRGDGIAEMLEQVLADFDVEQEDNEALIPRFALVGRPNVGKSTLTNKLVGEYRVIVSEIPGTTRDSVRVPLRIEDRDYLLVDTAGVRRKSRVDQAVEKFSVIKTLQAIEDSHVVLLVLDASSEIGAQDATIAGMIQDLGRSMVVVVNKWDRLEGRQRRKIKDELEIKLPFLPDPEILFVSALHGSNLAKIMPAAQRAFESAMAELSTSSLNRTLATALAQAPPPMRNGRPVKLKFAHQAGKNPPIVVVHGNQAEKLPDAYLRYLSKFFATTYQLKGTRVRIIPRSGENPFKIMKPKGTQFKKRTGRRRKI